jgi:hypothetical protein
MTIPMLEPLERRSLLSSAGTILFIRGGSGTGGFLEGGSLAQRDEQLSDITNTSTATDNKGWGQLAAALRDAGFTVEQRIEGPSGNNTPVPLQSLDLSRYDVIVFGSNNASYPTAAVDAVENYVRNGGGALFISDANFGSNWRDAPDSDQPFLSRFGFVMNQDRGTYSVSRGGGDFLVGSHPILSGIDTIDGEGVSPIRLADAAPDGVFRQILVRARNLTRDNDGTSSANQFQGTGRAVDLRDGAVVLATAGIGRVVGHFDRNTFFNANGIGTDLTRFDNRAYALNLFGFLAGNVQTGSLSGVVFDDRNANGTRQTGAEPGLAGRAVYLDLNNNGVHDVAEPHRITDAGGAFRFDGLAPGLYKLRQSVPGGWRQTTPANGFGFTHVVVAGQEIANRRFGQTNRPLIGGRVFADLNGNGVPNGGEGGLSGFRVFWDVNGNGRWSSDEPFVRSGLDGRFEFRTLPAGTYRFAITAIGGYSATTPQSVVVTAARAEVLPDLLFGQQPVG